MIKVDPQKRRIDIGVHDLIEAGAPTGDLQVRLAWRAKTRMREGQRIHHFYDLGILGCVHEPQNQYNVFF